MRILVVVATDIEAASLLPGLRSAPGGARTRTGSHGAHTVDLLSTGVGMVATAAWCSRLMSRNRYDLGLNIGLCGSFDRALEPGRVVHVIADRIAELGAEDGDRFLTVQELKLLDGDEFPFTNGQLLNPAPPSNAALRGLPSVSGITVNTVHGNDESIAAAGRRFAPQVESMEGAAFMYACLIHGLVFAQIRAVSNVVERRNREAWNIAAALESLAAATRHVLDHT
jgi:futalosine hydrolase